MTRQFNTASQTADNTMSEGGFPLKEGEHPFIITGTEIKATKANNGSEYLMIKATVDGGPQQGTDFMIFLNLWNTNQQAVEIAERELNTLRIACGFGNQPISDPSQLHNCRATAQVKETKSGKNKGEVSIKGYVSAQAQAPQPQNQAPAQQAAPQGNAAPWNN